MRKSNKRIKTAVIGYGGAYNMGRSHLEEMRAAGMTPTAVAEIDPTRLKSAEKDFPGIQTYSSVFEMLRNSDVDLVTIITPHNTHAPLALQCLKSKRHVVCEKPLAITTKEVDAMMRLARKNNLMLSTYHNRHWDGCILEAVRQIKKKKVIGDIVRIEAHMGKRSEPGDWWRSSKTISGGILYDWGVHLLEYALQLIDSDFTEITGYAHQGFWAKTNRWKKDTIEDEAHAVVRFKNGTWLTLTITQIDSKGKEGQLEITGTKGSYVFDTWTWKRFAPDGKEGISVQEGKSPPGEQFRYYRNIVAHLTSGKPLTITPEWSRRPIEILDLAGQSVRKGKALRAKYG